ncbi:MAG TPA: tRNA (N(6)-L-threonylcarbamoyladenosine(37)-C(2))-methylthiotransferase MtaB [Peptococcaceae bacterium]|nr:tRNA (N(6)-L-threonylcarbamoyladenosine(37)-C(2))-methylthiotransferase MtaB [Peptococcaceae bacterium]
MKGKTLKASLLTLGCKVNQAESEAVAQLLAQAGYQIVQEEEDPDVIIINTCTVTGTGSSKSRKLIRKLAKEHPLSTIVVMGCYSQIKPEEVAELEGVDIIIGTQDRQKIVEYLQNINCLGTGKKPLSVVRQFGEKAVYEELPLIEYESRARAMLKIQDGCSQFCTYCIIPYARGPSRSRDPEKVLAEAEKLLASGYKEIVLTGVHIGAYGLDLDRHNFDLAELLKELVRLPGMVRLRLGSIEPLEFTPKLLEVVTESDVVCPHFHIPLQSGSNTILVRMHRPYSTEDYSQLLTKIRSRLPEAAIATDILTGFPGETEENHQEALRFVAGCNFAGIHVFPYSRREGTPAASMPEQIPNNVKASRVRDYMQIAQESRKRYVRQFLGKPLEVLLETIQQDGSALGHTRNYLEVKLPPVLNPGNWQVGDLVECILHEEYIEE